MTLQFTVARNALVPQNEDARATMGSLQVGETIMLQIPGRETEADAAARRFVFMVIGRLARCIGIDPEDLRARLLTETGRCRFVKLSNGQRISVVQSMQRQLMDRDEMREFWRDAKQIIVAAILPMLGEYDRMEIQELLDNGPL